VRKYSLTHTKCGCHTLKVTDELEGLVDLRVSCCSTCLAEALEFLEGLDKEYQLTLGLPSSVSEARPDVLP